MWLAALSPCCPTSLQQAELYPFSTNMLLPSILSWEGRKLRTFAERNLWTSKTLLGKTPRDGWQMRRQNYSLHHESPEAFVYIFTMSIVTVKSPYHINEIQVILSASTRWHQSKNKNKAQTPFIPSFPHSTSQHWQPSSSQGNSWIKMLTATPHTSVSFLKCFAERVLHGPPHLPKWLQEKTQDFWAHVVSPFTLWVTEQSARPQSKTSLCLHENQAHEQ